MVDQPLGAVAAEQRLSTRIISPYLRQQIDVGIKATYKAPLTPIKNVEINDNSYEFSIPSYDQGLIDLKGILLLVGGELKIKR